MNIIEQNLNKHEIPKINLTIVPPESDKSWMITFDVKTPVEAEAYNDVISEILTREKLDGFHQIGVQNNSGFHGWEIWQKSKVNLEILNQLKLEITELIEKELKK
jgi:hypothetical protein